MNLVWIEIALNTYRLGGADNPWLILAVIRWESSEPGWHAYLPKEGWSYISLLHCNRYGPFKELDEAKAVAVSLAKLGDQS